jgi:hypothetical protein
LLYNGLINWRNEVTKLYIAEVINDQYGTNVATSHLTLDELKSLSNADASKVYSGGMFGCELVTECLEARGKGTFHSTYDLFEKGNIAKVLRGIKQNGECVLTCGKVKIAFSTDSRMDALKLAKKGELLIKKAAKITKSEYRAATSLIRAYITQEIDEVAVDLWKHDADLRDEYGTFREYLKVFRLDALEDEYPGGVDVEGDIFGDMF